MPDPDSIRQWQSRDLPIPDQQQIPPQGQEWFATPDPRTGDVGLRFSCTMCGNCCSGPEGYVLVSDDEIAAIAARLNLDIPTFTRDYTHMTREGRSLTERPTPTSSTPLPTPQRRTSMDCVFLDRDTIPGKAVCGIYEHRPAQCKTWPFWPSLVQSREHWELAKRICPGMGKGQLIPPERIRIQRDAVSL